MSLKKYVICFLILSVVFVTGCVRELGQSPSEPASVEKIPELSEMEEELGIKVTAQGVKYIVDPEKIRSGGPPKDGIPSLDDPKYMR